MFGGERDFSLLLLLDIVQLTGPFMLLFSVFIVQ